VVAELAMKFLTPLYNSGVGFFWRAEASNKDAFAVKLKSSIVAPAMLVNALEAAAVIGAATSVLGVLLSRSGSKIAPAVVGGVIVDVVDLMGRPFASHPKPSQLVLCTIFTVDSDHPAWTPVAEKSPGSRADNASRTCRDEPRKDAGFRIVVQHFAQSRGRDNGTVSHLSAPDRWMVRGREALARFAAPSF
jgi:hypothetical protein